MRDLLFPPSNGGYAKGQETREAILTAALRVLVDEGYAAMTMRRVAKECGIRFGNLTYHYRSHEDLVNALFEAVIGAYEAEFALIVNDPDTAPADRLRRYCRFVLTDIQTRETTHIFPEIWALANHSPFVARLMTEMYRRARAPILEILRDMRPDLSEQGHEDLALFVSATMEGMTMFLGHGKLHADRLSALMDIQVEAFLSAIARA
ncbi:TetR/AcrR family transcriptional regulator [Novosphingobium nitrogenifigens]|nr:TetR family transcriptional regulator C-terminal domain-containing protein [Novosphingobium nitrogenifigens]